MNTSIKKWFYVFAIVILACTITDFSFGSSTEVIDTSKVLLFLENVARLDFTKYNVSSMLGPFVTYPDELGGLANIEGIYHLKSEYSKIDVQYQIINNTVNWVLLEFTEGTPQFTLPYSSNYVDTAKALLQRQQMSTGDVSLNYMNQMLDMVDEAKNSTHESGNLKLEVTVTSLSTSFKWKNTVNGAAFSSLSLGFRKGYFYAYSDDRSYMKIGSTEVNLSKDEAVRRALGEASKFWYIYGGQNYTDFSIAESAIRAELLTAPKDRPLELYPYWSITLPLDRYYPGYVTMIVVEIWGDSGEIIRVYPLGTGGGLPDVSPSASVRPTLLPETSAYTTSPSPTQSASIATPSQSGSPSTQPTPAFSQPTPAASPTSIQPFPSQTAKNPGDSADLSLTYVAVAAVVVVVAVAVGSVAFLTRRRK